MSILPDRKAIKGVKEGKFSSYYKVRFGDVKIKWDGNLQDPKELLDFINNHINEWKKEDRPSIWVKLRGTDLKHLYPLIMQGFDIHRSKSGNVIVLNKWIREKSKTLPNPPFAYLGVGGMCINNEGQILAVRENYKTGPSPWKLPGGLFDPRKDKKLSDTAVREIMEETGIQAEPMYMVTSRFWPKSNTFQAPDLFHIFRLKPLSTKIKYDPYEIHSAAWVKPDVLINCGYDLIKFAVQSQIQNKIGLLERETVYRNNHQFLYMLPKSNGI
ncbi:hydrolase, NUDIX family protein [Trichomonas vaginalis G3]|uniref:Hydrolase, NUDIX family protein n=1 Tax=Trichomonas vaginalis (strain ATCC PRA-98 / G3) TaxID=412133 RepID=A2G5K1_TRIV3|nr:8-hydroxy-dADP phosphatase protein [Trichomonas vaginalis G3]EAX87562.1 hydrolase, NUDIX family protein [Trichomonas vaginalis G3]KAI5485155.1 8-hydroxy-dADP phosphatase protein [Trichomonas vaginalis G3]|eukprot:XP_001300492.1 hydrolase, NUDIX family protein [Trichomonas vaginalis G3]